ncbi:MAG: ribosome small subunit-dependent GTPase A [Syntrophomonadaceae bacterium]|nr:ribosome small subunit-dependent GTPase A [Syntrophomonadaceae bacterium]
MIETKEGLIIKLCGGFYYVQDAQGKVYECRLRGKLRQQVLGGDRVKITVLEEGRGILENIQPRRNQLNRPRIANVDLALIVMANDRPAPSSALLDRLLFLALFHEISPVIILNKCDLPEDPRAASLRAYYPRAGFTFVSTSAETGEGIEALARLIDRRVAVLAGPSGCGKSSLLNLLVTAQTKTGEVSEKIGRGRHTTRHVELFPLLNGGFLADSPGFSVLDLPAVDSRDLAEYHPDFEAYREECRFDNCLHYKETDCGVKRACEAGVIAQFRYQNYLAMLEEVIKNERCYR